MRRRKEISGTRTATRCVVRRRFYLPSVTMLAVATVVTSAFATPPWQNPANPLDVNDDGFVAGDDAIIVINRIGEKNLPPAPPFYNVIGQDPFGVVTPLDALFVINDLIVGSIRPMSFTTSNLGLVEVDLQTRDVNGRQIESIDVGETFFLEAFVSDRSESSAGIFAAQFDVTYDSSRVAIIGDPVFGNEFRDARTFDIETGGQIRDIGAVVGVSPRGREALLFSIPFQANKLGVTSFSGDDSDAFSLVFGIDEPVETLFANVTLDVVPEPSSTCVLLPACFMLLHLHRWIKYD